MNKIIDENHVCTFCDETEKPFTDGEFIYCPYCKMPQFEGVTYDPDDDISDEFSILDEEIIE